MTGAQQTECRQPLRVTLSPAGTVRSPPAGQQTDCPRSAMPACNDASQRLAIRHSHPAGNAAVVSLNDLWCWRLCKDFRHCPPHRAQTSERYALNPAWFTSLATDEMPVMFIQGICIDFRNICPATIIRSKWISIPLPCESGVLAVEDGPRPMGRRYGGHHAVDRHCQSPLPYQ